MRLGTRVARVVASWLLVGIAVPMLVRARLGVAPFDVLNSGLSGMTGWSFGLCFVLTSITFFGIGMALGSPLGWASPLGTVVIGPIIDVSMRVIGHHSAMWVRVTLFVVGIAVLATAISLVISTDLGPGPTEVVMLGLVRHGLGIVPARWIADGTPILVGASMGGAFGVGTVVFWVVMGRLVKFGLDRLGYAPVVARSG